MIAYNINWNFLHINRTWRNNVEVKQIFIKKTDLKLEDLKEFMKKRKYFLNKKQNDYLL